MPPWWELTGQECPTGRMLKKLRDRIRRFTGGRSPGQVVTATSTAYLSGLLTSSMKEAFNRGGINTVTWHLNNPVTGGTAWDTYPGCAGNIT